MIHSPYSCVTTDRFQKVLDVYRFMQVKTMCVVNPLDGSLQGIITRKDIFKYMAL
jgi:predicted transcriptional regulator